ncbi:hypothetical protein [Acinetobacter baumannii]|uniref:hypothetical protein n=1 Tax=Acinetobacter baumannii TaxID=470 RepID=UPI003A842E03
MDKLFRNFILLVIIFTTLVAINFALNTFINLPFKLDLTIFIYVSGFFVILLGVVFIISSFVDSSKYESKSKSNSIFIENAIAYSKSADLLQKNDIENDKKNYEETIEEAKKLLRDKFENISAESYFEDFKNKIKMEVIVENFEYKTKRIESRVQGEIGRLSRSGIINVSLGMLLSIGGILYLGIFVVNTQMFDSLEKMFVNTFPKAIFVLLIEVFAYFFLKLYKQNLDDIKYYQNELTNIESKNLAVQIAKQSNNHKLITLCIEKLLGTERNFILEKDQSTIEIEKERINSNNTNNTLQVLKDILKK